MLKPQPNILLLTLDTLRADRLGCYGRQPSLTPNIDELAEKGVRFTQAITGGSWTQAAFPALLTSTYPSMYGGCLGVLARERPSAVELLVGEGYATGAFSTIPHLSKASGYDRGFETFVDLEPQERDPFMRKLRGGQRLLKSAGFHAAAKRLGVRTRPAKVYCSAEEVVGTVCEWLEDIDGSFFGWAHFMDVHWPYHIEGRLTQPEEIAQAWRDLSTMHDKAERSKPHRLSEAERDHFIELYEQALAYLDGQIGRLIQYLDGRGLLEDTIIVAVADHGEEFGEHGYWGHTERNMYEEVLRVPLILRLPGGEGGAVVDRQVRLLDLMPTLLDLCGYAKPDEMEGVSMTPLWMEKEGAYGAEISISERPRDPWYRVAVRTEAYKYIWGVQTPEQAELYDLKRDPGERDNLRAKLPEVAAEFQSVVDAHRERVAESWEGEAQAELVHEERVMARLRDLGYVD